MYCTIVYATKGRLIEVRSLTGFIDKRKVKRDYRKFLAKRDPMAIILKEPAPSVKILKTGRRIDILD